MHHKLKPSASRQSRVRSALSFLVFGAAIAAVGWPGAPAQTRRQERGAGSRVPLGFSRASYEAEERWEREYLSLPDPGECRRQLRMLTQEPHVAGTAGDRHVVDYLCGEFERDGLKPEITEYRVLLSYPKSIAVGLLPSDSGPEMKLAHPEPPIAGDPDTEVHDTLATLPWNAYSPSADLTAPVLYAHYGTAEDYAALARMGISVRGRIVLVRYFHGYRGGKSLEAEKRGAAGVLVYSDPADDGAKRGRTYPDGPWGPLGHFQRGAVVYDFLVPGDPLTPGWPSTQSARRLPESESAVLPRIPMVPLSATDALEILRRLKGAAAPAGWRGGLPVHYRIGDGSTRVHLALQMERRATPIWNVIARIPGRAEPERQVILSNHHDAWVYGAVDPSSGTAAMLETARALGELLRRGFRPRRTIVLASWDAEEYTLTGSTEWGEEHEDELRRNAVACLNVDAATSGPNFSASMVPALLPLVIEATQDVPDPRTGKSIYETWQTQGRRRNIRSYAISGSSRTPVPFGILGGGSDFMVFLQHDGVPSLDMIFDGPYGVYHSVYDDYQWMARYGDPGFRYHAAMSRLWGLLALRLADADLIPLDYSLYAGELKSYLEELKPLAPAHFFAATIEPLIARSTAWHDAAAGLTARLEAWRRQDATGSPAWSPETLAQINMAMMREERALLDDQGIPSRPWFRHLVYAPLPSYEAERLPGLREALLAHDSARAQEQAARLRAAIERAISALARN
jgi:N-acetylated-alpha-linked acidic dipeptidase